MPPFQADTKVVGLTRRVLSAAHDNTIEWGLGANATYRLDQKWFGSASTKYVQWDASADTMFFVEASLVFGHSASTTVSNGDGTTALIPGYQFVGTAKADSSVLLASFNTTDGTTVAPTLAFLKGGGATIGATTAVSASEVLGEITFFGCDGTDFKSAAAQIACLVDTTPGTGDMPGRIVFSTSIDSGEVLTEAMRIDNAQKIIMGAASAQTVSNGDGSTACSPKIQALGTTKATGSALLASFSATATTAAAPSLNFLKSANATVGSNTVVVSGEVLGEINFFGADGTDFNSAAARIAAIVDTTPGTGDMPGRLVFSTSVDNAETLTEAMRIDNAQRKVMGAVAAQTVGGLVGSLQDWGLTTATAQTVLGCASTTAGTGAELAFARDKGATVGAFTGVASGDVLGSITAYAANGSNYTNPHAQIQFTVSNTPGASDAPGAILFKTTADGAASLTEAFRITDQQVLTSLAARPANVTAAGSAIVGGGFSTTDVTNASFTQASHGSGTVTYFIGNASINVTSDSRIKKDIRATERNHESIVSRLRVVDFGWNDPADRNEWGKNSRGEFSGFIAQEVIDVAPWAVNAGSAKDCSACRAGQECREHAESYWQMQYEYIVPSLVKTVQGLMSKVASLESKLATIGG